MNNDFHQIQQCLYSINKDLVIIFPENIQQPEVTLIPQLILQISIYGSKLIELYQSLDELCPTDRQQRYDVCKYNTSEEQIHEVSVLKVIQTQMLAYSEDIHDLQEKLKIQNENFQQTQMNWAEERDRLQKELLAVKMDQLNGENNLHAQRLKDYEEEIQKQRAQCQNLEEKTKSFNVLLKEKENLIQQQKENDEIQIAMQNEIAKLLNQNQQLSSANLNYKVELDDTVYKLQTSNKENELLLDRLRQLEQQSQNHEKEFVRMMQNKHLREKEFDAHLSISQNDESDKENYNKSLDQLHQKFSKFRKLYQERVEALTQQNQQLQRIIKQREAEVKHLQNTVHRLECLINPDSTVQSECIRLQEVIKFSSSELNLLRQQLDNVLRTQSQMESHLLEAQRENSILKQRSFDKDLLEKYQRVVERNEYLTQQLSRCDESLLNN